MSVPYRRLWLQSLTTRAIEQAFAALQDEIATLETDWARSFVPSDPVRWATAEAVAAHFPLDASFKERVTGKPARIDGAVTFATGQLDQAAAFDGASIIDAGDVGNFGFFDRFTISAWIFPRGDSGTIVARMSDVDTSEGYSLELAGGKLQANLSKRWLDDSPRVETEEPLDENRWQHVAMTYDGSRRATGVHVYVDGQPRKLKVLLDGLNQSFASKEPLRIGGGGRALP